VAGGDQYAVTEEQQAEFLAGALDRFASFDRVETLVWFLVRDEPPDPNGVRDTWQSGLRRLDGALKPSFEVWREAVGDGGATEDDPLDLFPSDAAMLASERARHQIALLASAVAAGGYKARARWVVVAGWRLAIEVGASGKSRARAIGRGWVIDRRVRCQWQRPRRWQGAD